MFSHVNVAKLLNEKFPDGNYNEKKLRQIAHSQYRTKLPRNDGENIIILSGELGYGNDHGYRPIAEVLWNGKEFKVVE
jgi:hypothetical protein